MTAPCALYRHYAVDGTLLYVGQTANPMQRLASHASSSTWHTSIARIDLEWHPSRSAALRAERRAIEAERPVHNIPCTPQTGPRRPYRRSNAPFARWARENRVKQKAIAEALGVSQPHVHYLMSDDPTRAKKPSRAIAVKIEALTNGAIPVSAWDDAA